MNIAPGDTVRVLRDIWRIERPSGRRARYANAGDIGVVAECFRRSPQGGRGSRTERSWYVKVRFGGDLKTLRLTSVAAENP